MKPVFRCVRRVWMNEIRESVPRNASPWEDGPNQASLGAVTLG